MGPVPVAAGAVVAVVAGTVVAVVGGLRGAVVTGARGTVALVTTVSDGAGSVVLVVVAPRRTVVDVVVDSDNTMGAEESTVGFVVTELSTCERP